MMSRLNVGRMWRYAHRAQLGAWEAELREAGALPLIAREILRDMANQCALWENLQCVMPQVIHAAQVNGVNNDPVPPIRLDSVA